jgi:hypothetical protein
LARMSSSFLSMSTSTTRSTTTSRPGCGAILIQVL